MFSQGIMKHEVAVSRIDDIREVQSCWDGESSDQGIALIPSGQGLVPTGTAGVASEGHRDSIHYSGGGGDDDDGDEL